MIWEKMAGLLGKIEDISFYNERLISIEEHFHEAYWNGESYYHYTGNGIPDDRANALAVLSGLAKKEDYSSILKVLQKTENASPYMEK